MALTAIEQLALWGPPILILLLSIGYYLKWGKEADERGQSRDAETTDGGNH